MPRIRLILEDDQGVALTEDAQQIYVLENDCDTLRQIERAVETFKNAALPRVEQTLLEQAQQRFTDAAKKNTP